MVPIKTIQRTISEFSLRTDKHIESNQRCDTQESWNMKTYLTSLVEYRAYMIAFLGEIPTYRDVVYLGEWVEVSIWVGEEDETNHTRSEDERW